MNGRRWFGGALLGLFGLWQAAGQEIPVQHADCSYFGPKHEQYIAGGAEYAKARLAQRAKLTREVTSRLMAVTALASPRGAVSGTIDRHLFGAMEAAGVQPAERTTDYEFIRRVSLDLTGRIPTAGRVVEFVSDNSPDKRAKLVDELLASPEWVSKWTMYFGDLFANSARKTFVVVGEPGRNAFHQWLRASLTNNKPYDQMARELISARGDNSFNPEMGAINWLVGSWVIGNPVQDNYDQQTATIAETFLGVGHMNCLLCHNGRGHLDELSLWGKNSTRQQAWQMAAFLARTNTARVRYGTGGNDYYWSVLDRDGGNYTLNTVAGNRPARCAPGATITARNTCSATATVTPAYVFNDKRPEAGENYRDFLAAEITSDSQFARASVNYIFKEFFGRGLVEPVNQFDPMRLDPDDPPAEPWVLQPSNARLLSGLASDFIAAKYDLKALMRQICNSEAYQLSSRYSGDDTQAEQLFARHLVRRLWAEEVHDSVALASNILPNYNVRLLLWPNYTERTATPIRWAMDFPEPFGLPDGQAGAVAQFLDSFLRGNRDDQERRSDGSLSQALNMMNDNFIMSRIRATGSGASASLLRRALDQSSDQELVSTLYLNVLSRPPDARENSASLRVLEGLQGAARQRAAENLLWALFNKVDFLFNY